MKLEIITLAICVAPNLVQAADPADSVEQLCELSAQITMDMHYTKSQRANSLLSLMEAMNASTEVLTQGQMTALNKARADYVALQESAERRRLDDNLVAVTKLCLEVSPLPKLP